LSLFLSTSPVIAVSLVDEYNIRTIEQLRKVSDSLNHQQRIGLKYFEEFEERIPRDEIVEIEKILKRVIAEIDPKLTATICGSYRRQKPTCGKKTKAKRKER
jgi:DNA polymerase beta